MKKYRPERLRLEAASLREQAEANSAGAWVKVVRLIVIGAVLVPLVCATPFLVWGISEFAAVLIAIGALLIVHNWVKSLLLGVRVCRFHLRNFKRWPWQS